MGQACSTRRSLPACGGHTALVFCPSLQPRHSLRADVSPLKGMGVPGSFRDSTVTSPLLKSGGLRGEDRCDPSWISLWFPRQ